MPSLKTSLPKYRRKVTHGGPPQAVVTLNGRDHYLGPYDTKASRVTYDALIGQWLASGRSPSFGLPRDEKSECTLRELIRLYSAWAKKHYRHSDGTPTGTHQNMKPLMKRLLKWYGQKPASKIRPLVLKDIVRRLIDEDLSISSVNDAIGRIRHMFRWAVSEELVPVEVYQALRTVAGEQRGRSAAKPRKIVQAVSNEVIEQTMPKLPEVVQSMVKLQRLTGMRPAEVCLIRPCDLQEYDGVWLYTPERHKTEHHGKSRVIVIAGKAQAVLTPYLGEPDEYCFSPRRSVALQRAIRTANRVTPKGQGNGPGKRPKNHGGDRYRTDSYRRAIHRACEQIWGKKGAKWSPNQLRHAAAEEIQGIGDIESVAAVLGHSKIDTSKLYAKHNLTRAVEVMKRLNGVEEL